MITIIILATILTFVMSLAPAIYKLANSGMNDKLHTEANVMELKGWGKYAQRAMDNHMETYVSFMALAVLVVFLGDRVGTDDITRFAVLGGWIYLVFRLAHWVCFTLSIPYLRTLSFTGSAIGVVMVGWSVFRLAGI